MLAEHMQGSGRFSTPTNKRSSQTKEILKEGRQRKEDHYRQTDRENEEEQQWHVMYEMKGYYCSSVSLWQSQPFLKYSFLFGFAFFHSSIHRQHRLRILYNWCACNSHSSSTCAHSATVWDLIGLEEKNILKFLHIQVVSVTVVTDWCLFT